MKVYIVQEGEKITVFGSAHSAVNRVEGYNTVKNCKDEGTICDHFYAVTCLRDGDVISPEGFPSVIAFAREVIPA